MCCIMNAEVKRVFSTFCTKMPANPKRRKNFTDARNPHKERKEVSVAENGRIVIRNPNKIQEEFL